MTAVYRLFIGAVLALLFSALFPRNVHAQTPPLKVALVHSDSLVGAEDVRAKLTAAGLDVTIINMNRDLTVPTPTAPTLEELLGYDAVFTWSNYNYAQPGPLGDVLAAYVDAGHGVVQAVFSFTPVDRFDESWMQLGGRWRAESYEPFSLAQSRMRLGPLTLIPVQPLHPILAGVDEFNGGSFSFYHEVALQGCADLIARWSNGVPLVAARRGPHGGRVVGLNFFPVSSSVNAEMWLASTDGGILMANALRYAATPMAAPSLDGPAVALLSADVAARANDVRCKLANTNLFSRIDTIDVQSATPTLATLLNYDALLTWTSASYNNPAALGNVLAAFVDQNRGVVQSAFTFSPVTGPLLGGAWQANGYRPLVEANPTQAPGLTLVPLLPGHTILSGVSTFGGGTGSYHGGAVVVDAAPIVVAAWSDGQPLAAVGRAPTGGRLVGLNMYPPSSDSRSDLWSSGTDGARLIANTLLFAANHFPTADAGADQSIEATSSAGASFTLNATGADLDGDALTYNWSGAASTTGQSLVVDVLPPSAPNKTQTYSLALAVSDGKGGEMTDTVQLTVSDTIGPVLQGMPASVVTAEATSSAGVAVTFGPVTAVDAVDGNLTVECAPVSGAVFPVGDTIVSCTSSDSRGNTTAGNFTVRVTQTSPLPPLPPPTPAGMPGQVFGHGFIRDNEVKYEFLFAATEKPSGREDGNLLITVKSEHRGREGRPRNDHFVANTVEAVTFSDSFTVRFTGTGRWNGRAGYRYEVAAVNNINTNQRHRDAVRITIKGPGGVVVAYCGGTLAGGNVQIWTR
jgi:hypothetical protein